MGLHTKQEAGKLRCIIKMMLPSGVWFMFTIPVCLLWGSVKAFKKILLSYRKAIDLELTPRSRVILKEKKWGIKL